MDNKIQTFIDLADIYESHGYHLYLVGGTVRDYLLNIPLTDTDAVTDATPEQQKEFIEKADYTFSKYGSIKVVFQNIKFDVTTLRKESGYVDSRHPNQVVYTDKLEEDVTRRDITINALYLSKDLKVVDLVNGQKDIKDKVIRIIGDPDIRFKEDPLRIIRLLRFKFDLGFEIEDKTLKSLQNNASLIYLLNKDKVHQELKKSSHQLEVENYLKQYC